MTVLAKVIHILINVKMKLKAKKLRYILITISDCITIIKMKSKYIKEEMIWYIVETNHYKRVAPGRCAVISRLWLA